MGLAICVLFLANCRIFPVLIIRQKFTKKHFVRWQAIHQRESLEVYKEQQQNIHDRTYDFPNEITKNMRHSFK